jgi:hypothetical protein
MMGFLPPEPTMISALAIGAAVGVTLLWSLTVGRWLLGRFHRKQLANLEQLTPLKNQTRRDSWNAVEPLVRKNLEENRGRFSLRQVKDEYQTVFKVYQQGSMDIREAINEIEEAGDVPEWAASAPAYPDR